MLQPIIHKGSVDLSLSTERVLSQAINLLEGAALNYAPEDEIEDFFVVIGNLKELKESIGK
jgi:hypothetical protein